MKKMLLLLASLSASSVFAYTTTLNNQTPIELKLVSNGGQSVVATVVASSSKQVTLDAYTTYQLKYAGSYSDQSVLTIQKNTNMVIQDTPVAPASGLQDLKVNFNSDSFSGWFYTLYQNGQMSYGGVCQPDTGGLACTIANGANLSNLSITISGGSAPKPVDYTFDAGDWNSGSVYQPQYGPTKYPKVKYTTNGKYYVACWYAAGTNVPGAGDPWREYDANKNVCQ